MSNNNNSSNNNSNNIPLNYFSANKPTASAVMNSNQRPTVAGGKPFKPSKAIPIKTQPTAAAAAAAAAMPSSVPAYMTADPPSQPRRSSLGSRPSQSKGGKPTELDSAARSCACCHCTQTPMWRDGRNGLRLCNACGIRWQKYGICCKVCFYVPRKLENSSGTCKRCNAELPPAAPTRRRVNSISNVKSPY